MQEKWIEAWSDGAAGPETVTGAFAGGEWMPSVNGHNVLVFDVLLASTIAATYLEAQIHWSPDGGTTVLGPLDVENIVSGGVVEIQDMVIRHMSTADGHHTISVRDLIQGAAYRIQLRQVGGTAVTALVYAYFGVV